MFINANTYRINEDEDESDSDNEEIVNESIEEEEEFESSDDVTTREPAYDFRTLSTLDDEDSSLIDSSRFRARAESEETAMRSNCEVIAIRRRVYSDPEVESETLEMNLLALTPSSRSKPKEKRRSLGSSSIHKSVKEITRPTQQRKATPYGVWPFPRTRTHSDSYIDQKRYDDELKMPSKGEYSSRRQSNQDDDLIPDAILFSKSSRRQSLPVYQTNDEHHSRRNDLRTRTFSDSLVHEKSVQGDILWDPRNIGLIDTEQPMESQKEILLQESAQPSASSSVLATLSPTNDVHVRQRPLLAQNPSPRTLNAASKIAAALLPAPAKIHPAIPSPSARRSADQYYWGIGTETKDADKGQEMELKDLCSWSSDSYDDIL